MVEVFHRNEHQTEKNAKIDFEKDFFMVVNNAVFGKTTTNLQKLRDMKAVAKYEKRHCLVSEPNYH